MTSTASTKSSAPRLSIRKNDRVQVMAGREKGKIGKVLKVDQKNSRLIIEKVNLFKKHVKPNQQNPQGGILEKEGYLHYSNVLLFCPKCNRGVRHGMRLGEATAKPKKSKKESGSSGAKSGGVQKSRFCKKCNESLELN